MTQKLPALWLALAFALAQGAAPASAQTRAARLLDDWSAVQTLSPGQKIVVRTKDGDRLTGRFDSANDLLINFTDGKRKVSLTRESVRRVQLDRGSSRAKGALFGAVIGAGAGFGAAIHAATSKGNKNETVYEAP